QVYNIRMAGALVSTVLEQLHSLIMEVEVEVEIDVKKVVNRLIKSLIIVQGVLEDAENKQMKNEAVRNWLEELKDVLYETDDVVDEWITKRRPISQIRGTETVVVDELGIGKKVLSSYLYSCFCFNPVIVGDFRHKILKIEERMDMIVRWKYRFNLNPHRSQRNEIILGRDLDKEVIVSRLLSESSHGEMNFQVISIIGTGGFGKTTLAKLVFNEVSEFFDYRIWVCVSDPFDLKEIANAIIREAKQYVPLIVGWEALHQCLCESLKGKRFLLVLDDVWNIHSEEWISLKHPLNGGASGSRVIVTSRTNIVAKVMDSSYIHWLGQLSTEDCWLLFKNLAFCGRQAEENEMFDDIGKEIAKKCKGVPLAVKILGSVMYFERTIQDWRNILVTDIWDTLEFGSGFQSSLILSYHALPPPLKQCFLYCAIFPKGKVIERDSLIKLWMAQGFLDCDGRRDLEIIGGEFFVNLAMRSLFQDLEVDFDGNITSCKMHDLVQDFAQFLTQTECSIRDMEIDRQEYCECIITLWRKNLRTLMAPSEYGKSTIPVKLFYELARLRALDFSDCDLEELPLEVGRLLHLRYLDLSSTKLRVLPETICHLKNLQTLKLNRCRNLIELPKEIGKVSTLRHLEIKGTKDLDYMPRGIGKLSFLRTLDKFIVGGKSDGCEIGELHLLNHIQGKLKIMGLGQVSVWNEAVGAELKKKQYLRELTLDFGNFGESDVGMMENVLENLEPPEYLYELVINGYQGCHFPCWIMSRSISTNSLRLLVLRNCERCTHLPALGKFPSLEKLVISGMSQVKYIGHEFFGLADVGTGEEEALYTQVVFPKLRKLKFYNMEEWEEWASPFHSNRVTMPCLRDLTLVGCPKLRNSLNLLGLKSLEILHLHGLDSMAQWEDGEVPGKGGDINSCLREVVIAFCPKLKLVPRYMFSHTLRHLWITQCPELRGMQPCIPPLLESLVFRGDLGVLSESLPLNQNSDYSNYPELKSFTISCSPHPSLPLGFSQFTAIQTLKFLSCESLDFELSELKHLNRLKELHIYECPILNKRFAEGKDWSILSYVPKISINCCQISEDN
ncbi:hypothetical protein AQUCO_00100141v1, partial [Aquilegia coerulea]